VTLLRPTSLRISFLTPCHFRYSSNLFYLRVSIEQMLRIVERRTNAQRDFAHGE
jgi:hypothetical protein